MLAFWFVILISSNPRWATSLDFAKYVERAAATLHHAYAVQCIIDCLQHTESKQIDSQHLDVYDLSQSDLPVQYKYVFHVIKKLAYPAEGPRSRKSTNICRQRDQNHSAGLQYIEPNPFCPFSYPMCLHLPRPCIPPTKVCILPNKLVRRQGREGTRTGTWSSMLYSTLIFVLHLELWRPLRSSFSAPSSPTARLQRRTSP